MHDTIAVMSLTSTTKLEMKQEEGLRELEALGCPDSNLNVMLLDHYEQDVEKLFDTLAPCRDCKAFVIRAASTNIHDQTAHLKKFRRFLCTHGFNNTKHNVPPAYMCSWGYGYYLCCNCSLRDGWQEENYYMYGCSTCKQKQFRAGRTPSAG